MIRILLAFNLIISGVVFGGCIIESPQTELFPPIKNPAQEQIVSLHKIIAPLENKLLGYLEEVMVNLADNVPTQQIYYVRDRYYKRVGLITERGGVYRYDSNDPKGRAVKIGDFPMELAIQALLHYSGPALLEKFEPEMLP